MSEQVWQMRCSLTACLSSRLWQACHRSEERQSAFPLPSSLACTACSNVLNWPMKYRAWEKCEKAFIRCSLRLSTSVKFLLLPLFLVQRNNHKHFSKCGAQLLVPAKTPCYPWELPAMVPWPSGGSVKMTCTDVHVDLLQEANIIGFHQWTCHAAHSPPISPSQMMPDCIPPANREGSHKLYYSESFSLKKSHEDWERNAFAILLAEHLFMNVPSA